MPTVEFNIESQIASEITRTDLQTLISTNAVERKQYYITNAVNNTRKVAVFYRSPNQTTFGAVDVNTGVYGRYFIVQDMFIPILEAQGAVLTYINLASFPAVGVVNTVYIAQDTGTGYTWNGSAYVALSGGTVFAANFGALPVTGAANTLYITTDNGNSYLWNGSAYIQTSSGTQEPFVESVTGFSVDNTDPLNPIIKAIPTGGTNPSELVTGPVQFTNSGVYYPIFINNGGNQLGLRYVSFANLVQVANFLPSGAHSAVGVNGNQVILTAADSLGDTNLFVQTIPNQINVSSSKSGFQGIVYNSDFSPNYTLESLISLKDLKSRLWNKAGVPTTSDDTTQGYVANQSLILDTTTGIIYRCTNATAGAATWSVYYNPSSLLLDTIRIGSTVGAGLTRYAAVGVSGLSTTLILNLAPKRIHRNFRVVTGTAQSATGAMTISRVFTTYAGVVVQTDTLTIPANSPVGEYVFSGATFNASAGFNVRFDIVQGAGTSAFIQGIENEYE